MVTTVTQLLLLTLTELMRISQALRHLLLTVYVTFSLTSRLKHGYLDIFFHTSSLDSKASRTLVCIPSLPSAYKEECLINYHLYWKVMKSLDANEPHLALTL